MMVLEFFFTAAFKGWKAGNHVLVTNTHAYLDLYYTYYRQIISIIHIYVYTCSVDKNRNCILYLYIYILTAISTYCKHIGRLSKTGQERPSYFVVRRGQESLKNGESIHLANKAQPDSKNIPAGSVP